MIDNAWTRLYAFAEKKRGFVFRTKQINRDSALFEDLDLDGIEGVEFMEAFFEVFKVEPGDYDPGRYFGPEGFSLLTLVAEIFSKKARQKAAIEPLTLGTLEKAIVSGKFDSSVK